MTIKERIAAAFKTARLERDEATKGVIGQLKSKMLLELKSAPGVEETDELWLKVLSAYAKEVKKAMQAFEEIGERGEESLEEARFELAFCEGFLPKKLGEEETEALVRKIVTDNGISGAKMMGKVMGLVMKDHRDEVDGDLVRQIAQKVLAEGE